MCAPVWITPSMSIVNKAGVNRESVLTTAATYVPVLPSRTVIAFAASFTSESNPQLPIATNRRVASDVVTFPVSIRTVGPAASAWTVVARFRRPIACAKSSAVPEGNTASVVSVPIRPLAARPTVPSPPMQPTVGAPPVAAARTRSCRSGPDVDRTISCGMPAWPSSWSTFPTIFPALPLPAAGFATTTIGATPIGGSSPSPRVPAGPHRRPPAAAAVAGSPRAV